MGHFDTKYRNDCRSQEKNQGNEYHGELNQAECHGLLCALNIILDMNLPFFIMHNSEENSNPWYVYMLQCSDGTLYTGITTNPERRIAEHNQDNKLGARYTRTRRPVYLVYQESCLNRSEATRREAEIRKLSRQQKLNLAQTCAEMK